MEDNKLNEFVNTEVTVIVLHKPTNQTASKFIRRRHVRAFAEACVMSFVKKDLKIEDMIGTEELEGKAKAIESEFSVIEIDWKDQSFLITSLSEKK